MHVDFEHIYRRLQACANAYGIEPDEMIMDLGKPGEFDGISVTMNAAYRPEERTYYLAHAIGSMVCWSMDKDAVKEVFQQLTAAKNVSDPDPVRLERALDRYRRFETESSQYAVWLFAALGHHSTVVHSYTNFMRADLEAMLVFHRQGELPVWREFFSCWNEDVAQGRRTIAPFTPKPVPQFRPVAIDRQEIFQRQGQ